MTLSANSNPAQAASDILAASNIDSSGINPVDASDLVTSHQIWTPSNGGKITTDCAIALVNATAGFKKPNVLDVKLGARLWADDAPLAKRAKLEKSAEETTSKPLGFRIAGMKTWQGESRSDTGGPAASCYRTYDKNYGRWLTVDTVRQGFEEFFFVENAGVTLSLARKVIARVLVVLRGLQDVLEKCECRMYSASLLFVYEGDGKALQQAFEQEDRCDALSEPIEVNGIQHAQHGSDEDDDDDDNDHDDEDDDGDDSDTPFEILEVKLIDFAHASWTPGQGPDENLLHGVRNVIKILNELCG